MGLLDSILSGAPGMGGLGGMGGMGGLGGGRSAGISPIALALIGTLAYRTLRGKGALADMLGTSQPDRAPSDAGAGPLGGLGGILSSGTLSDGLGNLVNRMRSNGQGDKAESWVSSGANKPIAPHELGQGLGEERISWLMEQTGMSRDELLSGLAQALPSAVDQLTPAGRLPSEAETRQLMQ
jgi:uncharacterized protein YidB (DUF937 family)